MYNREPYQRPDLDSIEELNYVSTYEEDIKIDAYIEQLREWGYGSIVHVNDLHQLFWEFTRRGIILDKLFRVAVVECIDEETLYTKFLGMAKRYNGWAQRQVDREAKEKKDYKKEIAEKDRVIEELRKEVREAQQEVGRRGKEIAALKRSMKPQSEATIVCNLRHELKKEYNLKLQEQGHKTRPVKMVGNALLYELKNVRSRFSQSFDLTDEQDARQYIKWFRLGQKKINAPTLRNIIARYGEDKIGTFLSLVQEYNEEWTNTHQGEPEEAEDAE